ncbi:MAG TPA: phosphoglycerate mutase, partial [Methylocystis sp.]|nr:phosphoglycerate mutase [Methylocystis sp.]
GIDVGPAVASFEFPLLLPSGWVQGVERYFLVRCPVFEPDLKALTESEASYVLGWKWWSKDEIAASNELIYPEGLANMLGNMGVG